MDKEFHLPRVYANAYPFHPRFFTEIAEAITREAYYLTFAPDLPAVLLKRFREYSGTEVLRTLQHATIAFVVAYPHRSTR